MKKNKVVILGGGYAGIQAIRELANRKNIEITLIDQNNYHYLQTEVYDFIANKSNLSDITIDLNSLLQGIDKNLVFFNAKVLKIDHKEQIIITNNGEINYDFLLISTGSRTNLFKSIKGIREFSHGVKSLNRAIEFKQKFENILYSHIKNNKCEELNIVVGGGGLSGIEIATEMAYIRDVYLKTIGSKCDGIKIFIVDGSKNILNGFPEKIVRIALKRLNQLNIFVKVDSYINQIDKEFVYLESGEKIKHNLMIFTGGIIGNSIEFQELNIELNQFGQYFSDDFFRLKLSKDKNSEIIENIFLAGDVAEIKNENDEFVAPTAQVAEQMGIFTATNILKSIKKQKLVKKIPKNRGILIALGGTFGVNSLFDLLYFKGYSAHLFKHLITNFYKNPLQNMAQKGLRILSKRVKKPIL
jgi:NADH dehydrogenase